MDEIRRVVALHLTEDEHECWQAFAKQLNTPAWKLLQFAVRQLMENGVEVEKLPWYRPPGVFKP